MTGHDQPAAQTYDRSYLERTIATVRNHRDADNCWPSWANIFADEIERLWDENEQLQARLGCVLAFARPVDIQAAELHIAEHGLVDAEGNRLES